MCVCVCVCVYGDLLSTSACRYEVLLQEKEDLQEAYDSLHQELVAMEEVPHSSRENRMLQKLTKSLEVR